MTSIGLNTGLRALLGARFSLDTIGHNIANANTPGYSRQRVEVGTATPLQVQGLLIGSGVDAQQVGRIVDELLVSRLQSQRSVGGSLEVQSAGLSELEAVFNEPGENGLGHLLQGLFSSVSQLSTAPEDSILRSNLAQNGDTLAARFHLVASSLNRTSVDGAAQIEAAVGQVNQIASELAELNVSIGTVEASGEPANDLRDRQGRLLDELSGLIGIRTVPGPNGTVRVLVQGHTLVSSARAHELELQTDPDGMLQLRVAGGSGDIPVEGGRIGGLLRVANTGGSEYLGRMDALARSLILEFNRVHAQGIPSSGPLTNLTGSSALMDRDRDGNVLDELLSNAGLPFDVRSGQLRVNITNLATGDVTGHTIEVSETHTTVGGFLGELNGIPGLSAELDTENRVRLLASNGFGFDFSRNVDRNPDSAGTFGGGRASLGTSASEPFVLANGETLDFSVVNGGTPVSFQIALDQTDFAEISTATAEELAAVINADPGALANGLVATAVDGHLYVQTLAQGSTATFSVDGGTAVAGLGWTGFVGQSINGSDNAVAPQVSGRFTGENDEQFTFRPNMDGVIGTTPGLAIEIFDRSGQQLATLPVGEDYVPGSALEIGNGLSVRFNLGELSATNGDSFTLEATKNSDTSDALVALGLNTFFSGSSASDIRIRSSLLEDPSGIASSGSGATGDGQTLLDLLNLERNGLTELSGSTLGVFYGDIVSDVGFETSTATSALESNAALVESLENRRDAISGVNVDEELVDLVAFEQAFAAASQYIATLNELGDEILNLV